MCLWPLVPNNNPTNVPSAATIVQNKAVAQQGLEAGEEEENRGREEVEDMGLGWMEACCTALDLHAEEPAVQVGHTLRSPAEPPIVVFVRHILFFFVFPLWMFQFFFWKEAASWAIHNLLLHGAGVGESEEEQDKRCALKQDTHTCCPSLLHAYVCVINNGCWKSSCHLVTDHNSWLIIPVRLSLDWNILKKFLTLSSFNYFFLPNENNVFKISTKYNCDFVSFKWCEVHKV